MPEAVSLSVVVPVKDEAGNVAPLANEIAAALKAERNYEIIFVDDGSNDATAAELLALKPALPLRLLAHRRNLGQSRALRTGVRAARGELIVTLDGDGQNDPADIPKLLAVFRAEAANPGFAMVAGERVKRRDTWQKRLASRLANRLRRFLLGELFPKHASLMVSLVPPSLPTISGSMPHMSKAAGFLFHSFYVPGIEFMLTLGNRTPDYLRLSCVASNPIRPIMVGSHPAQFQSKPFAESWQ